jgi:hypothetical protein
MKYIQTVVFEYLEDNNQVHKSLSYYSRKPIPTIKEWNEFTDTMIEQGSIQKNFVVINTQTYLK